MSDIHGDATDRDVDLRAGDIRVDEMRSDAVAGAGDTGRAGPTPPRNQPGAAPRDPETRRRDHDAINRLTDAVLPDLIERLASRGLGEIEVREDDWRIRLRRPPATTRAGDHPTDRRGGDAKNPRSGMHTPTDLRPLRETRDAQAVRATVDGAANGNGIRGASHGRVIATSPAVGIFQPRSDVRPGTRVRAGDRLATVDLLGLPQDVVAPEDGVVVDTLAEDGQGVEYGQDLVVIEPARSRLADATTGAGSASAPLSEA